MTSVLSSCIMSKFWLVSAAAVLLVLSPAVTARRCPLLRAPESANKTGCYIVVLRENTTDEKVDELLQRAASVADEHKVYGFVKRVTKAITLKLSDYSMEMVSAAWIAKLYTALLFLQYMVLCYCSIVI